MKSILLVLLTTIISLSVKAQQDTSAFCKNVCGKEFKLKKVEEFGLESEPEEKNEKDYINLNSDKTVKMKFNNKGVEGKWVIDKTMTNLTVIDSKNQKIAFKVLSHGEGKLALQYQDPATLIKTKFFFESN